MNALAAKAIGTDSDSGSQAKDPVLKDRFEIRLSAPLPEMGTPASAAFMVDDRHNVEGALFAMMSSPDLPLRVDEVNALTGFNHPHVMRLVSAGDVVVRADRPPAQVAIYEYPISGSAMPGGKLRALRDHEVPQAVIAPICHALVALCDIQVSHRAIRPDNLFYAEQSGGHLIVGDCLSGLPGQWQPIAFEPIERAFAPPMGRGAGGPEADMYAFGATVLSFLLGGLPCAGLDDEEILRARIERGSFAALCGNRRFSPDIEAFLNGTLADRIDLRWGLTEVRQWLKGHNVPHKIAKSERASAPFLLEDNEYWTARGVADALNRNWGAAASAIRSERLESWLTRGLDSPAMANSVAARRGEASGSVRNKKIGTDEMISRVCIALDPDGPIRYRGISVAADGIGSLLADAMVEDNDELTQTIAAILARNLPSAWIEAKAERRSAATHRIANFLRYTHYVGNPTPGFGLERCLYELNPGLRCLSPILHCYLGRDTDAVLQAVEARLSPTEGGGEWLDRHIAGFLGAKMHPKFESRMAGMRMLNDLAMQRTITGLILFATAKRMARATATVNLARTMHKPISDIVNSFHSRSFRKAVGSDIDHFVKKGDIIGMERLLVDHKVQRRDQQGFRQAIGRYLSAEQEIRKVRNVEGAARRVTRAQNLGQRLAARAAYVGLAATIVLVVMSYAT